MQVSVLPTWRLPTTFEVAAPNPALRGRFRNGSITGFFWLMNAVNAAVRMYTSGRNFSPHAPFIVSGPQLVTPICTGPAAVGTTTGPPLSPGHAWISGVWWARSSWQPIDGWIAGGYASAQSAALIRGIVPCCSGRVGAGVMLIGIVAP